MKSIDGVNHFCGLFLSNGGADGEGKLLGRDALGDGEIQLRGVPGLASVALLVVRRDGVMDHRADALRLQIVVQSIAFAIGNQHREEVIDILRIREARRQGDERIAQMLIIVRRNSLPMSVVLLQVLELNVQHRGLNLVQAGVAAGVFEDVFLLAAVVGQGPHRRCQFRVVGGHGAAVAQGAEVLAGVEAEPAASPMLPVRRPSSARQPCACALSSMSLRPYFWHNPPIFGVYALRP